MMDSAPLNKAHQLYRKAENLLKHKKFDDCIECHKQAVECLQEAHKLTDNSKSLESLRLQKEYHQKAIDVVRMKKRQHQVDQTRKVIHGQRKVSLSSSEIDSTQGDLETEIYKTIELHDSLIDWLGKRGDSDKDSLKSYSNSDTDEKNNDKTNSPFVGNKHPKDDSQIIEELKVLSGQLRNSVHTLLIQLDDRNKEIEKLKATIKTLEEEKGKDSTKSSSSLKVVTDSSGGTSPYIFSPCSELSPDVLIETGNLPPLEMPNFDFLSLMKNNNNNPLN